MDVETIKKWPGVLSRATYRLLRAPAAASTAAASAATAARTAATARIITGVRAAKPAPESTTVRMTSAPASTSRARG